jgi:ketosteroid isomerase-like protein
VSAKEKITTLLHTYESALNASSTSSITPLYTPSGVFMAQHFPTAIGHSDIQSAYDKTFEMTTLSVKFEILEIEVMSEEWAFARTASKGKVKVNGGEGELESEEGNQELFVLRKEDGVEGEWKIARYCFCSVMPPH